ncbi:hypothetical protein GGR57DRAFT_72778 [Xylariaceae sp. FL1272]|nr:hypothetical protein GGR57DRAFT_72778 [Xylariaceae sp. FL1272]
MDARLVVGPILPLYLLLVLGRTRTCHILLPLLLACAPYGYIVSWASQQRKLAWCCAVSFVSLQVLRDRHYYRRLLSELKEWSLST